MENPERQICPNCGTNDTVTLNCSNHIHIQPITAQARQSFWVIERFENGKSAGYWDGANSRSFQPLIYKAIQFHRKEDAFWATRGWHWSDTKITEHLMLEPTTVGSGDCLKKITRREHVFTNSREWVKLHLECGHFRMLTAEEDRYPYATGTARCHDCEDKNA